MKRKIEISHSEILLVIFFALYFQPVIIERISGTLDKCFRVSSVLMFVAIMFVHSIHKKNLVLNTRFNVLFLIFHLWNFACIVFMAPNIALDYIKELVYIAEFWAVLNMYSDEKEHVLNALAIVSTSYIIINSCSLFLYPNGFFMSHVGSSIERAQWILGSKNNIALYTIIFLMFIHITAYNKSRFFIIAMDLMAFISVVCSGSGGLKFFGGSSTGIAACGICLILLMLNHTDRLGILKPIVSMKSAIVLLGVLNAVFLFGTIAFGNYISGLFDKKLVYGGRIPIWQSSLRYIKRSPLFGYGYNQFGYKFFNGSKMILTTYTYNTVLGIMIRYGMVSLIILIALFVSVKSNKSSSYKTIMCFFFSLGVWGIMNELDLRYVFIPIFCMQFVDSFEELKTINDKRYIIYTQTNRPRGESYGT